LDGLRERAGSDSAFFGDVASVASASAFASAWSGATPRSSVPSFLYMTEETGRLYTVCGGAVDYTRDAFLLCGKGGGLVSYRTGFFRSSGLHRSSQRCNPGVVMFEYEVGAFA